MAYTRCSLLWFVVADALPSVSAQGSVPWSMNSITYPTASTSSRLLCPARCGRSAVSRVRTVRGWESTSSVKQTSACVRVDAGVPGRAHKRLVLAKRHVLHRLHVPACSYTSSHWCAAPRGGGWEGTNMNGVARPKSIRWTVFASTPCTPIRKFCGLMSRCTSPCSWNTCSLHSCRTHTQHE